MYIIYFLEYYFTCQYSAFVSSWLLFQKSNCWPLFGYDPGVAVSPVILQLVPYLFELLAYLCNREIYWQFFPPVDQQNILALREVVYFISN